MTAMKRRRGMALLAGGLAAGMLLAACGGSDDSASDSAGEDTAAEETAAEETGGDEGADAGADDGDGAMAEGCDAYADYMGNEGTTVNVFTSILPPEQQLFEEAWLQFEECTGIDIVYEGSDQFEAQLPTRIAGGNAPDIAWIPQPGLLAKLVADGGPVAAPAGTEALVDEYWNPAWKQYGTVDGTFYAAPLGSNMKSFVWYSPTLFAENGYEVPTTWDELWALSDQMVADGIKPWCGGLESGGATGWPATDWLEQIMLRLYGGDVYDQWVAGEVDFQSPEVEAAMDVLAGWMKNPEYVNGGYGDVQTIALTPFQDAGAGIVGGECGMLQQASFYANFWANFDETATVGPNGTAYAFYLPEISSDVPQPVVGGGEFVAAFADRPEVQAVQTYMASPDFHTKKAALGNWVSANSGVPLDTYAADSIDQLSAQFLTDPSGVFRFDASDLMPAAVGAGEEWVQMTAWFAEDKPTAEVLADIDAAWPAS